MTREERKRANRIWFAVRLGVFVVGLSAFFLIMVGTEYLSDAIVALTWNG